MNRPWIMKRYVTVWNNVANNLHKKVEWKWDSLYFHLLLFIRMLSFIFSNPSAKTLVDFWFTRNWLLQYIPNLIPECKNLFELYIQFRSGVLSFMPTNNIKRESTPQLFNKGTVYYSSLGFHHLLWGHLSTEYQKVRWVSLFYSHSYDF